MISTLAFIGSQAIWAVLVLILIRRNDDIRESYFELKANKEVKKTPNWQVPYRDRIGHGSQSCGTASSVGITSSHKHDLENKITLLESEKKELLTEMSTLLIEFEDANNRNEAGYKDYFNARIHNVMIKILPQLKRNNLAENNVREIESIITSIVKE